MGQKRFARLMELLPADLTVFGIDEKTALLMEPQGGTCQVFGLGGVTLIHPGHEHDDLSPDLQSSGLEEVARQRAGHVHQFKSGKSFKLMECCPFVMPEAGEGLPEKVWEQALEAHSRLEVDTQPSASPEVMALVEARARKRACARIGQSRMLCAPRSKTSAGRCWTPLMVRWLRKNSLKEQQCPLNLPSDSSAWD